MSVVNLVTRKALSQQPATDSEAGEDDTYFRFTLLYLGQLMLVKMTMLFALGYLKVP